MSNADRKSGAQRPDAIEALIGHAYDAALAPELWPDIAPRIAAVLGTHSTALATQSGETTSWLSGTANLDDAANREYEVHFYKADVWAKRAAEIEPGRVFESRELISDVDFLKTEFYQDWLRKRDIFYVVGSVIPVTDNEISILGIHRPQRFGAFDNEAKAQVTRFLPHLQRALQIRKRFAAAGIERDAALDALERTGLATLVVRRNGHILYANAQAEMLLVEADGIRAAEGRITAASGGDIASALLCQIDGAAGLAAHGSGECGAALAIPRGERLPLSALIAPFRPARDGFGASEPAAIVFIRDPEALSPGIATLCALFGLTAAEAAIASAISEGRSVKDIAAMRSVSLNTVRTHLKEIYFKTGTSRQAELAARIMRSVAMLK